MSGLRDWLGGAHRSRTSQTVDTFNAVMRRFPGLTCNEKRSKILLDANPNANAKSFGMLASLATATPCWPSTANSGAWRTGEHARSAIDLADSLDLDSDMKRQLAAKLHEAQAPSEPEECVPDLFKWLDCIARSPWLLSPQSPPEQLRRHEQPNQPGTVINQCLSSAATPSSVSSSASS